MFMNAINALSRLFERLHYEYKMIAESQNEIDRLAPQYFKYLELLGAQEIRKEHALKLFGILGVFAPECPKVTFKILSPSGKDISSQDIRKNLKLWEILEAYLRSVGESKLAELREFFLKIDMRNISMQAIDSALKTHSDLFQERNVDREKLIRLRAHHIEHPN